METEASSSAISRKLPQLSIGWVHSLFNDRRHYGSAVKIVQLYDFKQLAKSKKWSCLCSDGISQCRAAILDQVFQSWKMDVNCDSVFCKVTSHQAKPNTNDPTLSFLLIIEGEVIPTHGNSTALVYGIPAFWYDLQHDIDYQQTRSTMIVRQKAEEQERERAKINKEQAQRLKRLAAEENLHTADIQYVSMGDDVHKTADTDGGSGNNDNDDEYDFATAARKIVVTPFKDLSLHSYNPTIQGRVEYTELRNGVSKGREWFMLKVGLVDANGDRLQLCTFNPSIFNAVFEQGTTVTCSQFKIKLADPQYNPKGCVPFTIDLSVHSVVFKADSVVIPIKIPGITALSVAKQLLPNSPPFAVMGFLVHKGDVNVIGKAKNIPKIRTVIMNEICDLLQVDLLGDALCGAIVEAQLDSIVVFDGCTINEYNGATSVSCAFKGQIMQSTDQPELLDTKEGKGMSDVFYASELGNNSTPTRVFEMFQLTDPQRIASAGIRLDGHVSRNLSPEECRRVSKPATMAQVQDTSDYFKSESTIYKIRATLMHGVSRPKFGQVQLKMPWYYACPKCRRKASIDLDPEGNSRYSCQKCACQLDRVDRRYVWTVTLSDDTGAARVTLFDEVATQLLGTSADMLVSNASNVLEEEAVVTLAQTQVCFEQFFFYIKRSLVVYENQEQLRLTAVCIESVDMVHEARNLIERIKMINPHQANPEMEQDVFTE